MSIWEVACVGGVMHELLASIRGCSMGWHHMIAQLRRSMRTMWAGGKEPRVRTAGRIWDRRETVGRGASKRYELLTCCGATRLIGTVSGCRRVAWGIPMRRVCWRSDPIRPAIVRRPSTDIGPRGLRPVLVGVHAFWRGGWRWRSGSWVWVMRESFVNDLTSRRLTA